MSATCGGIRVVSVYVPNGREPGSDHYQYKLAWLAALREMVAAGPDGHDRLRRHEHRPDRRGRVRSRGLRRPDPRDPARARGAAPSCEALGLHDVVRERWPDERVFTYWDYRAGMFHQDLGMRIDLVLAGDRGRRARQGGLGRPPGAQGQRARAITRR